MCIQFLKYSIKIYLIFAKFERELIIHLSKVFLNIFYLKIK